MPFYLFQKGDFLSILSQAHSMLYVYCLAAILPTKNRYPGFRPRESREKWKKKRCHLLIHVVFALTRALVCRFITFRRKKKSNCFHCSYPVERENCSKILRAHEVSIWLFLFFIFVFVDFLDFKLRHTRLASSASGEGIIYITLLLLLPVVCCYHLREKVQVLG